MLAQIPYAEYGSRRSFYGNIQLGAAPKLFQVYGAWPEERPAQPGMLIEDWQDKAPVVPVRSYANEIAARIEIIRQLKAEIDRENDLKLRNILREHMQIEREAKERAFKLKAMVDEEEAAFILLH